MDENIFIKAEASLKGALKKLNLTATKVLLVIDDNQVLLGSLSDGDIRRYILDGNSLETTIGKIYNKKPIFIYDDDWSEEEARKIFLEKRIELIPLLDRNGRVVRSAVWDDVFSEEHPHEFPKGKLSLPVVIMAGGKGNRLAPFTSVLPKPLIPIGDKTILELIISEFYEYGIKNYYLTLNYRGDMIRAYFDGIEKDYDVRYVLEKDFYGTAGSLKLLENQIEGTFIVSNCDIIVKANYEEVTAFHIKNSSYLTILSSIQNHKIPYGIIEFKNGGEVTHIREKPEFTFPVNTGVYILDSACLSFIPENQVFDMTDLIEVLIREGKKVLTYPVNEKNYIDIGQWEEYQQAIGKLKSLL